MDRHFEAFGAGTARGHRIDVGETASQPQCSTRAALACGVFQFGRWTERAGCFLWCITWQSTEFRGGPLLEDLETAYQQIKSKQKVALPAKTASYKTWAERLQTLAESASLKQELPYWTAVTEPSAVTEALKPLAMDAAASAENTEGNAKKMTVALDEDATRALLQTRSGGLQHAD